MNHTNDTEQSREQLKGRFLAQRGVWDEDWEALLTLSPSFFRGYLDIRDVSQRRQRLSPKVQEFIYIAVAACCTHMHSPAVRAHVKAALRLGATKEEIMDVINLTYLVGIHTVTLGVPTLLELLEEQGKGAGDLILDENRTQIKKKFVERRGFWTNTWNPLLQLDPDFFDSYVELSSQSSRAGVLSPVDRELITCAFDAATTHLYSRGTKIHMRNALNLGATPEQIMEVLEITSLLGIHGVTSAASVVVQAAKDVFTTDVTMGSRHEATQRSATGGQKTDPGLL